MISPQNYSSSLCSSVPRSGQKRLIDGQPLVANKRVKVNQDALILRLPIDVLREMMCFTDWLTDTRAIALTCRTFKRVVDRRPQVVLAKALFFLRCHPLTYLADDDCRLREVLSYRHPYCDSLADVPFARNLLLTSLQPMLSRADITNEHCSVADTERLRNRLDDRRGHYFDDILHYLLDSNPSDLFISSFLTPLVSYQARSHFYLASKLRQKGGYPKIQERLTLDLKNEQAFNALLKDRDWTEEKIKSVDWSFAYMRNYFQSNDYRYYFITLLGNVNWWQSLPHIHLPRDCLLTFLLGFEEHRISHEIIKRFLKTFSEHCDSLDFMKCALKTVNIKYRTVVYSCCSERLKLNRDLALYAIRNGLPWCDLPPIFLEDREIFLAAVSTNSMFLVSESANPDVRKVLENIKKLLKEDKEFLLNFLKNCVPIIGPSRGLLYFITLSDLPTDFLANQQFLQEAAQYHPEIFTYMTQNFENVQNVVALIKQISPKLLMYCVLSEKWKTNEEVGKALIEKIGDLDLIPAPFRSNREIALRAIAKDALNLFKTPLCMEREFACNAFEINPKILGLNATSQYHPPLKKWLAQSRPRVLKAVQVDGYLIRSVPPRFQKDPEIAVAACLQDPLVIQWLSLSKSEDFLLSVHHHAMQRLQPLVQVEVCESTTQTSEPIPKG